MVESTYAVVAYLPGELGRFVDGLRKRLNPGYASWLAHTTLLTPRPLTLPAGEIVGQLREACADQEPFDIEIHAARTFWPASAVVFLSFSAGAQRLEQLHNKFNSGALSYATPFPYVPHVTIAQELHPSTVSSVLDDVSKQWSIFQGERSFRVESFFLVEQVSKNSWRNLALIPLSSFFYAASERHPETSIFSVNPIR